MEILKFHIYIFFGTTVMICLLFNLVYSNKYYYTFVLLYIKPLQFSLLLLVIYLKTNNVCFYLLYNLAILELYTKFTPHYKVAKFQFSVTKNCFIPSSRVVNKTRNNFKIKYVINYTY